MPSTQVLTLPGVAPENLPSVITQEGPEATRHFFEFFVAGIRNPHTRVAYARNVLRFLRWCEANGLALRALQPFHLAAYIESLDLAVATVKQHHSSLKMLFDWLVVRQVMPFNPASSVKTPRMASTQEGKTPILQADEVAALLASIDTSKLIGLRDRALIGTMAYTFARVSAVVGMNVGDFRQVGRRYQVRLMEKNGKHRLIPVHHMLEEYLHAYIEAAGFDVEERKEPLFRSVDRGKQGKPLSDRRLHRKNALDMVKRRAKQAGFDPQVVMNHTFRGSGITNFLENGGSLEDAQYIAGHASSRTTKLYDRRQKNITISEIERIRFG